MLRGIIEVRDFFQWFFKFITIIIISKIFIIFMNLLKTFKKISHLFFDIQSKPHKFSYMNLLKVPSQIFSKFITIVPLDVCSHTMSCWKKLADVQNETHLWPGDCFLSYSFVIHLWFILFWWLQTCSVRP